VLPNWTPSTPACVQQASPTPVCVNLDVDTSEFLMVSVFFNFVSLFFNADFAHSQLFSLTLLSPPRKLRFLRQRVRHWLYVHGRTVRDPSGEFVFVVSGG